MPLIEAVGKPILSENCQDENQKRKFMSRLWHLIAASLFLPLYGAQAPSCQENVTWPLAGFPRPAPCGASLLSSLGGLEAGTYVLEPAGDPPYWSAKRSRRRARGEW